MRGPQGPGVLAARAPEIPAPQWPRPTPRCAWANLAGKGGGEVVTTEPQGGKGRPFPHRPLGLFEAGGESTYI